MRNVEHGLAASGELANQVPEQECIGDVESGLRFIKNEEVRIVQERGGYQQALLHSLGIAGDGRPAIVLKAELQEETFGTSADNRRIEFAQTTGQLQVFETGEEAVEIRFFWDVAEAAFEAGEVFADVATAEENGATCRSQQAGDHFDGGGFAGAIGAEVAGDFSGAEDEADVIDDCPAMEPAREVADFEHCGFGRRGRGMSSRLMHVMLTCMSAPSLESLVIESSVESLRLFVSRFESCFAKLTDEQIWMRGGENQNAPGNLVLHLAGNVRQWIICGLGGGEDKRVRQLEFDTRGGKTGAELLDLLRGTVTEAIAVIQKMTTADFLLVRDIQGYQTSGVNAVLHVVEHFGMHTGQVILLTKMIMGEDLGFYRYLNATGRK